MSNLRFLFCRVQAASKQKSSNYKACREEADKIKGDNESGKYISDKEMDKMCDDMNFSLPTPFSERTRASIVCAARDELSRPLSVCAVCDRVGFASDVPKDRLEAAFRLLAPGASGDESPCVGLTEFDIGQWHYHLSDDLLPFKSILAPPSDLPQALVAQYEAHDSVCVSSLFLLSCVAFLNLSWLFL